MTPTLGKATDLPTSPEAGALRGRRRRRARGRSSAERRPTSHSGVISSSLTRVIYSIKSIHVFVSKFSENTSGVLRKRGVVNLHALKKHKGKESQGPSPNCMNYRVEMGRMQQDLCRYFVSNQLPSYRSFVRAMT